MEACAVGRAMIASDIAGCRVVVRDGENGILVPPRDADALADAMRTMIAHPDRVREMGTASAAFARTEFDSGKTDAIVLDRIGA